MDPAGTHHDRDRPERAPTAGSGRQALVMLPPRKAPWGRTRPQSAKVTPIMAYRKRTLTEAERGLLLARLARARGRSRSAQESERIEIYEAWDQGLSLQEIATDYGVSTNTVGRWKDEGERLVAAELAKADSSTAI